MRTKSLIPLMVPILLFGVVFGYNLKVNIALASEGEYEVGYSDGWHNAWQNGYALGWAKCSDKFSRYDTVYENSITKQEVIDLLVSYRYNHQYFVDNPDKVGNMTGSVIDNTRLVENYTKIINFVETAR